MNLASRISIFRILLVPFFVASILYYTPQKDFLRFLAFFIFLVAILSDALDGYIARIGRQRTRLGTFLDPLADKLLLISGFICLAVVNNWPQELRVSTWILIVVLTREVVILLGAALIHVITGNLVVAPSKLGKLTTFFQMTAIVSLLLQLRISLFLCYLAAIFTVLSGLDYIRKGTQILNTG